MNLFLQNVISGLSVGSVYALLAVGLVLIYKSSEVLNFAHGSFAMLATFVAYHLVTHAGLSLGVAMVGALIFAFVFGAGIYGTALNRAREGGSHAVVMTTIGLLMICEGTAGAIWGTDTKEFHHFFAEASGVTLPGGLIVSVHDACILGVVLALVALLSALFRFTRMGIALRAVSQNPVAAELMGVRVARAHALSWGLASVLGAIAGLLVVPKLFLEPSMMFAPTLKAFAAAVLGGMSSVAGAVVGGWILGIVETLAGAYVSTEFQASIAFLVIVLVLGLRPEGLLGKRLVKKV